MSCSEELNVDNNIAQKVHELYDTLGKSGKPKDHEEWTCLAGFVMEVGCKTSVVSLSTGTKCVGGNSMVVDGTVVNDSHAEVLARRNLLRYLYDQITVANTNESSSIFTKLELEGKFVLNEDVKFHFYVSQVPCGDASIIPMKEGNTSNKRKLLDDEEFPVKKIKNDVHRTGAKPVKSDPRQDLKQEGANYHSRGAVRMKPGRGDPTKSLSCSDKIAKWLFCGVQGGLLSTVISKPIWISSIIIGSSGPFDVAVLKEALVCRSRLRKSPVWVKSNLVFKHSPDSSNGYRPCAASINWADVRDKKLEVSVDGRILGLTKKSKVKPYLLTSKYGLLEKFHGVIDDSSLKTMSYKAIKEMAEDYQNQKKAFISAMGSWSDDKSSYQQFCYQL